jgi:hypothetical protein
LNDSERAEKRGSFGISKEAFIKLVDAYKCRKFTEDLEIMKNEMGGVDKILEALKVDEDKGIDSISKPERDAVYDSNHKDPPEPTHFCEFCWEVLQDLML